MKVAAAAEELRSQGVDVVDFGAGEPDFPTPDNIKRAGLRAIEENFTKYTSSAGTLELRQAICDHHKRDFGTGYMVPECVVSSGGKHAIFNLMQALIHDGDEVIIPNPHWVTYKDVVQYAGGKAVFFDTSEEEGFAISASMIEKSITPKTRMVVINSPCNPSGAVIPRDEFERIYAVTSRRDIWLMTDECYCHFLYDDTPYSVASIPGAPSSVLVAGSLSKTYSMTGWRIGFALAPPPVAAAVIKLQSQSTSNPNSVAQKAAVEALRGHHDAVREMLAEYRRRRDFVVQRLRRIPGVRCAEPKGAFYAYPNISAAFGKNGIQNTMDFAHALLDKARVAAVPGEAFGTTQHIRISYATSMHELERGLDRLHKFIVELG